MILVPVLVVALVVLAATAVTTGGGTGSAPGPARVLLDERLARGEISPADHDRRAAVLAEGAGDGTQRLWVVALAVAVVVGLGAVAWNGGVGWAGMDRQMAAHMGWTDTGTADPADPAATSFEVVATDMAFTPVSVTIPADTRVNLVLRNDGRALHDLTVPELGFAIDADAGEVARGSVVVDEPGTYEFRCSVPGHAASGMRGELVVTEAPA